MRILADYSRFRQVVMKSCQHTTKNICLRQLFNEVCFTASGKPLLSKGEHRRERDNIFRSIHRSVRSILHTKFKCLTIKTGPELLGCNNSWCVRHCAVKRYFYRFIPTTQWNAKNQSPLQPINIQIHGIEFLNFFAKLILFLSAIHLTIILYQGKGNSVKSHFIVVILAFFLQ